MTGPNTVLIEVDELADLVRSASEERAGGPVLLDVRWTLGGPSALPAYEAGHLPGAQFVELETELSGPHGADPSVARAGGRHPLPSADDFQAVMRRVGVSEDRPVIVYDQATSLSAARLWWLLTDAGHPRVQVLNGGFDAWQDAGQPVQTGPAEPVPNGDFSARPGQRARLGADEIAAAIDAGRAPTLVDVRAYPRYTGATEPMDPVAGHIPGALSAPSPGNQDADGKFLSADAIRDRYADLDADPVFYCGSGITAAHTLLARESAGLTGGAIYAGSWSDWVSDPDRPVATGDGPQL